MANGQGGGSNKELRDGKGKKVSPEKGQAIGRLDENGNGKGAGNKLRENYEGGSGTGGASAGLKQRTNGQNPEIQETKVLG